MYSSVSQRQLSVVCVDDNADILQLLCLVIHREPDMRCTHSFSAADQLIEFLETAKSNQMPEIVVLDWSMPGMSAQQAIETIKERWPDVRVVVYSAQALPRVRDDAIDAGAWGFVHKDHGLDALLDAIRTVAGGELVMK